MAIFDSPVATLILAIAVLYAIVEMVKTIVKGRR